MNGCMNKENVVCLHGRVLISHKIEGNPATCDNMHAPGGHSAK